jgi:hypothetical protein
VLTKTICPVPGLIGKMDEVKVSSTCTGAYTTEIAAALTSHIINLSGMLPSRKSIHSVSCCESW